MAAESKVPADGETGRSSLGRLLGDLLADPGVDPSLRADLSRALTSLGAEVDGPFLSVLLRTQGRRLEPLRDALLCLAGQSDDDFEVILIDHDAEPDSAREVRDIVASQPDGFRGRIRIVEVSGGSRSTPLNRGVEVAVGRYVAVYDDDDLVLGNWVEAFRTASVTSNGRLLRSIVATQRVTPERWGVDLVGFRALDWPRADYAPFFDQFSHFQVNHSPFMSWAFPRSLFSRLGLRFDEELTVCEDWDMILRGSLLLGVVPVDSLTAVYRRWEGAASSYTVHSGELWRASEARVIAKLDASVLVLPEGSASRIRELLARDPSAAEVARMTRTLSWRVTAPIRRARPLLGRARRGLSRLSARLRS